MNTQLTANKSDIEKAEIIAESMNAVYKTIDIDMLNDERFQATVSFVAIIVKTKCFLKLKKRHIKMIFSSLRWY